MIMFECSFPLQKLKLEKLNGINWNSGWRVLFGPFALGQIPYDHNQLIEKAYKLGYNTHKNSKKPIYEDLENETV